MANTEPDRPAQHSKQKPLPYDARGVTALHCAARSGDAAEVIPMRVSENWRSAAKKINFSDAMNFAIDLNKKQYFDMHEGLDSKDLDYAKKNEFVIDQVGDINRKNYQNFGIEFHRYIS